MEFNELVRSKAEAINKIINTYLPDENGIQKVIFSAMNYSVEAGGKRLRPMFMSEVYHLFGGTGKEIEPFMAAIEMIHTYSLVHDDLPAMDNDTFRRGKETTHIAYGEDIAILAGDALLNYSIETALKASSFDADPKKILAALKVLYEKAGIYGMIGGQTVDVQTDREQVITREKLDFIYKLKTSALIEASFMIGGILAGVSEEILDDLEKAASDIGLAFQIQDDILDLTSSTEELGKPVGSDERNKKATYVTFEGIEKSSQDVEMLSNQAINRLKPYEKEDHFLTNLVSNLITRKK